MGIIMSKDSNQTYNLFRVSFFEEILRTISKMKLPFMLKGSLLHAKYYPDPIKRLEQMDDIDFVYLKPIDQPRGNECNFRKVFTPYMQMIIDEMKKKEYHCNGYSVEFCCDEEGNYEAADGYLVDYKMEDDFLTAGLSFAFLEGASGWNDYDIEITMNLPLYYKPVSVMYQPLTGEPFEIPYATLPEVQVAWKLHQCLVRPRGKDIVDLIYMLQGIDWTQEEHLTCMLKTLVGECMLAEEDQENLMDQLKQLLSSNCAYFLIHKLNRDRFLKADFRRTVQDYKDLIIPFPRSLTLDERSEQLISHFKKVLLENLDVKKCLSIIEELEHSKLEAIPLKKIYPTELAITPM